ncbi:MAG: cobalamin-dependent protein [Desulfobacterales bacterium]
MTISLKEDVPHILLINPWIHDFAAYDFWAKPLGLLYLAAILRRHGLKVSYIDCLDRFHPGSKGDKKVNLRDQSPVSGKKDGRGPYLKTLIPKPQGLEKVARNYSRYGIYPEWFVRDLKDLARPDLILVTTLMTYWYPGVKETIEMVKKVFPKVPIVAGGIYVTLCSDHASKNLGADHVVLGPGEEIILRIVSDFTGYSVSPLFDFADLSSYPYPAFDLQHKIPYAVLMTSRGCPFSCAYCASGFLESRYMTRPSQEVVEEIKFWHKNFGVVNFAFYDDALLVNAENHAFKIFEAIINAGLRVRFHTPNALHICEINKNAARLMYRSGFETIRLGLETAAFDKRSGLDRKVTENQFRKAVSHLLTAGFKKEQIGAYLLTGLPDQDVKSVTESIEIVKNAGITPVPAHYSPIPHTRLWENAVRCSRYELEADPVFTNNAIFPCQHEEFSWQTLSCIKQLANGKF